MENIKLRATEKFDALHEAATNAADTSKQKVTAVVDNTVDTVLKVWHHELVAGSRIRIINWIQETIQRIRNGAPLLSPMLLYRDLVALFQDRMWRHSLLVFGAGAACGGAAGLLIGLRWTSRPPTGPHCRALHSHPDGGVVLVEDAVASGASTGEVLVRVQAFSVNTVDRAVLRGRGSALRTLIGRPAVTVGRGFAGVVLDVGPGVADFEMGDEVWGCISEWSGGAGTELLTARATRLARRPRGLTADAAAAVPWDGVTALNAVQRLRLVQDNCKNKRIVIAGAASGEGCLAVQLLSSWGCHVTAAAPSHASRTLTSLGVEEVVNIESPNSIIGHTGVNSWDILEREASVRGPWDALIVCNGTGAPPGNPPRGCLRASAPKYGLVDIRPHALLTDRLISPISIMFAASFYMCRSLKWITGNGWDTDFLENKLSTTSGLQKLTALVDSGQLRPVLDKIYGPQDYELALAHACSDDALGTTVIRFP